MTLKQRNHIFYAFQLIFGLVFILTVIPFFVAAVHKALVIPNVFRFSAYPEGVMFVNFHQWALFSSILLLALYSVVCSWFVIFNFEKTKSVEIFFFSGFLLACSLESFRLLIPATHFLKLPSEICFFVTRIVFIARLFAPASFILATVMKSNSLEQDSEKYLLFALIVALLISVLIPVDGTKFTSILLSFTGFSTLTLSVRVVCFILAFVGFILTFERTSTKEMALLPLWFVLMVSGYAFLISCDNFFFFSLGTPLLFTGTYKYIRAIHQNYLWV